MSLADVIKKYTLTPENEDLVPAVVQIPQKKEIFSTPKTKKLSIAELAKIPVPGEEALVRQFYPLAVKFAKKYCSKNILYEDMFCVIQYGILEAVRTYNELRDAKLITHVQNRVQFAISHYTRTDTGVIRLPYRVNCDRSNPDIAAKIPQRVLANDNDWMPEAIQEDFSDSLHDELDIKSALSILTDTECGIIMMRCQKLPNREISEKYGFSRVIIDKIYNDSISKMQNYLKDRDLEVALCSR